MLCTGRSVERLLTYIDGAISSGPFSNCLTVLAAVFLPGDVCVWPRFATCITLRHVFCPRRLSELDVWISELFRLAASARRIVRHTWCLQGVWLSEEEGGMPENSVCEGLCLVEQHDWEEERVPGYVQFNGQPHIKPGASDDPEFPATATDAQIWHGEDFTKYTEGIPQELMATMYINAWREGVQRRFPANKNLDCKTAGCRCVLGEKPTVVEGWKPKERSRVIIDVPHVARWPVDGSNPPKIKAMRAVLKGVIRHRVRIVRGICSVDPNEVIIVAPSDQPPETE